MEVEINPIVIWNKEMLRTKVDKDKPENPNQKGQWHLIRRNIISVKGEGKSNQSNSGFANLRTRIYCQLFTHYDPVNRYKTAFEEEVKATRIAVNRIYTVAGALKIL